MEKIIKVRDLTKKFGSFVAVDNISFDVKEGQVFAFLGPNGAGKTTTIKMLTTLLRPTSGEIMVNGFNPVTQQDEVRNSFGIVFQDSSVDEELTAWENMDLHGILYRIPKKQRKDLIEELLKMVDLYERKNEFVKNFSGGMRRRLEIARGLLHNPKILFLDEPTLGLDAQTRIKIWDQVTILNKDRNIIVFFTTHYLEEAEKMAERIAIIDSGRIVAYGSAAELRERTKSDSLEEAYLKITGKDIRDENINSLERMRFIHQRRRR